MAADPTVSPGVVDTVTSNTANLLPILLTVGGLGIAVAAGLLALTKGWGVFRRSIGR
jgi:hypothetical protein